MVFDKDNWTAGGAQYRCAECGCLDNEYRWKKNSLQGKWHAEHPERPVRGFHMNKIGSTLCGWDKIVEDFIAADMDAKRGVFYIREKKIIRGLALLFECVWNHPSYIIDKVIANSGWLKQMMI